MAPYAEPIAARIYTILTNPGEGWKEIGKFNAPGNEWAHGLTVWQWIGRTA